MRRCRGLWEGKRFNTGETERLEEGRARVLFLCFLTQLIRRMFNHRSKWESGRVSVQGNAEGPEKE